MKLFVCLDILTKPIDVRNKNNFQNLPNSDCEDSSVASSIVASKQSRNESKHESKISSKNSVNSPQLPESLKKSLFTPQNKQDKSKFVDSLKQSAD